MLALDSLCVCWYCAARHICRFLCGGCTDFHGQSRWHCVLMMLCSLYYLLISLLLMYWPPWPKYESWSFEPNPATLPNFVERNLALLCRKAILWDLLPSSRNLKYSQYLFPSCTDTFSCSQGWGKSRLGLMHLPAVVSKSWDWAVMVLIDYLFPERDITVTLDIKLMVSLVLPGGSPGSVGLSI